MPLIVSPENWEAWLNAPTEEALALQKSLPNEGTDDRGAGRKDGCGTMRALTLTAAFLFLMFADSALPLEITAKQLHDRCSTDDPVSIMGCASYILGFTDNERSQSQPRFCVPMDVETNAIAFGFNAYYAAAKPAGLAGPALAAFLKQDYPCKT